VAKTRTKRTTKRETPQQRFLRLYVAHGTISHACRGAGVGRTTVHEWRTTDPVFAEAFAAADEEYTQRLEREADRRAVEGVRKLKFHKGVAVTDPATKKHYVEREYSDALLMFRLKARRPELYRERSDVNVTSPTIKTYKSIDLEKV
jgi:uncharacterized protein YdaU (DUF1376 family)